MAERRTSTRTSSTKRTAAAKKGGAARARQQKSQKAAKTASRAAAKPAKAAGVEAKTVAEFREALRKNLIKPSGMVMLTRERGRKETNDVLKDLEGLLDKGRRDVSKRAGSARGRAVHAASPAIARADRARRAAKVGSSFPISLYEDLNVGEIKTRLADLTPAELRKVRDHERRNANRKGVLSAIESKLK